jgi:hypothetical protein
VTYQQTQLKKGPILQQHLPLQDGHKRRDVPENISAGLKAETTQSAMATVWVCFGLVSCKWLLYHCLKTSKKH